MSDNIITWRGKDITKLTQEELIEALSLILKDRKREQEERLRERNLLFKLSNAH